MSNTYNVGWLRDNENQIFIPFTYTKSVKLDDKGNTLDSTVNTVKEHGDVIADINATLEKIKNGEIHSGIADSTKGTLTLGNKKFNGSANITIEAKDLGITGALTYIGISTFPLTDKGIEKPYIDGKEIDTATLEKGSVALYSNNGEVYQEYLWTGTYWELLGDEGSYAYRSISVEAGAGLTGGGTLADNFSFSVVPDNNTTVIDDNNRVAMKQLSSAGTYGQSTNVQNLEPQSTNEFSVPYFTVDDYGRIVSAQTKTIRIINDSAILDDIAQIKADIAGDDGATDNIVPRLAQVETRTRYINASSSEDDNIDESVFQITDDKGNIGVQVDNQGVKSFDFILTKTNTSLATKLNELDTKDTALGDTIDELDENLNNKISETEEGLLEKISEVETELKSKSILYNPGTIQVDLESNDAITYTDGGNITPGVLGILQPENGGTGNVNGRVQIGQIRDIEVNPYSTSEGLNTNASGAYSHAEGASTNASGSYSHAEGESANATGTGSHAEGCGTIASGRYSHAGGYHTKASGNYSTVFGERNDSKTILLSGDANALTYSINLSTTINSETLTGSVSNSGTFTRTVLPTANSSSPSSFTVRNTKVYTLKGGCSYLYESYKGSPSSGVFTPDVYLFTSRTGNTFSGLKKTYRLSADLTEIIAVPENSTYYIVYQVSWVSYSKKATGASSGTRYYYTTSSSGYATGGLSIKGVINIEDMTPYQNGYFYNGQRIVSVSSADNTITVDRTLSRSSINNKSFAIFLNRGAIGTGSFVTGLNNSAQGEYQTVIGKNNLENTTSAFIIGNGTSTTNSNAYTIDWDGNSIQVGTNTSTDFIISGEENISLLTEIQSLNAKDQALEDSLTENIEAINTALKDTILDPLQAKIETNINNIQNNKDRIDNLSGRITTCENDIKDINEINIQQSDLLMGHENDIDILQERTKLLNSSDYQDNFYITDDNGNVSFQIDENGNIKANKSITAEDFITHNNVKLSEVKSTLDQEIEDRTTKDSELSDAIDEINGRINKTVGTTTQPIYFNDGTPTACTGTTVPTGGGAGQALIKTDTTDGNASWEDATISWTNGTTEGPTPNIFSVVGDAIPAASASTSGIVTTGAQTFAGNKIFSGLTTINNRVIIGSSNDVVADTADTGALIIGDPNGQHIAFDDNEIMAKSGSGATASTLYLNNEGGKVQVGSGGLYGAVWNDYAEFRAQRETIEPGYCVASADNGKVYKTTEKFQACDGIVSDTAGFFIGETNECQTPLAVAGRVLAYFHGNREDYHSGDTVCAGPDGKVMKMTREEIREWPDRIIGIVSEIPEYEIWGSGNIKVNNRIWIKVK